MPVFGKKKREGSGGGRKKRETNGGTGIGIISGIRLPALALGSTGSSASAKNSGSGSGSGSGGGAGAHSVGGNTTVFRVSVPDNVTPGEVFQVDTGNRIVKVQCPPNARPGQSLQIDIPVDHPEEGRTERRGDGPKPERRERPPDTQMFELVVPEGVRPGQPFALMAGGVRVLVTCPMNANEGQKIRFDLPLALTRKKTEEASKLAKIKLSYDKDGWTRTIRVSDMKVSFFLIFDGSV